MPSESCPFEEGRLYRVNRTVAELGHNFAEGEIVRFSDHSYDPKLGVTRFRFRGADSDEGKAWHVWDSEMESLSRWEDIFVPED